MALKDLLMAQNIELSEETIQAFFLGCLTGRSPLPSHLAIGEILDNQEVEASSELTAALKDYWQTTKTHSAQLIKSMMLAKASKIVDQIGEQQEKMDYFLMGLTLAGTNSEDIENEELADLLEEMEDLVLEADEWLAQKDDKNKPEDWQDDGQAITEEFAEAWLELIPMLKR